MFGWDAVSADRMATLWTVGTRQTLERWEALVAGSVRSDIEGSEFSSTLNWQGEIAHHITLVAARNLIHALDLMVPAFPVDPDLRAAVIELRDLLEHWPENMPVFNADPRPHGAKFRSGKDFEKKNPIGSPYTWWSWSNIEGPKLGPHLTGEQLHDLLDRVEATVLAREPRFLRFVLTREASPWLGPEAGRDRWLPKRES